MITNNGKRVLIVIFLLSLIGLYEVYSASSIWANYTKGDSLYYLNKQLIFMAIGYVFFYIFSKINLEKVYKFDKCLLVISFVLLLLVLVPGISIVKNGSRSWLGVGSLAFQPSELSKFALIIFSS